MMRISKSITCLFVAVTCLTGAGCLRRPATPTSRMIEPQLLEPKQAEPAKPVSKAATAIPVRLLDTEARGHIGRRVLHQQPNGELTADTTWRWSTSPERYLDTALRLEAASSPDVLPVETDHVSTLAAMLLEWELNSKGGTRLVASVEFQVTSPDRVVHTKVVRSSEPVSAELPGDLGAAAGRLLRRLAAEGLRLAAEPPGPTAAQMPAASNTEPK